MLLTVSGAATFLCSTIKRVAKNVPRSFSSNAYPDVTGETIFELNEYSNVSQFEKIIHSEEERKQIELIINDYHTILEKNGEVPSFLSLSHMQKLMNSHSFDGRKRFFKLSYRFEISELVKLRKRELRKVGVHKGCTRNSVQFDVGLYFDEETGAPKYGLWKNSMFIKLSNNTLNYAHEFRLFNSSINGQNLVIDLSYEKYMKRFEITNAAEELTRIYSMNKSLDEPYNLWFCNFNKETLLCSLLKQVIGNTKLTRFAEESYLSYFPKSRLVYLSPDAETPLLHYDHDDVYIIGAFIDSEYEKDVSRSKALREGILMRRFPINEFTNIHGDKQVLEMPQVASILMDLKRGRCDWKTVLERRIPKRRIINPQKMHQFTNKKQFVAQN